MTGRVRTVLGVLLADAREHRIQTAMTLLGVAVGVAVIVAIRLASEASLQSFRGTFGSITGRATHQLSGVEPLPAARLPSLAAAPGVEAVQPVVAATVLVRPAGVAAAGPGGGLGPPRVVDDAGPRPDEVIDTDFKVVTEGEDGVRSLRLVGIDPFFAGPFLELDPDAVGDGDLFRRLMLEPGLALVASSTLAELGRPDGGPLVIEGPDGPATLVTVPVDDDRLAVSRPPFAVVDIATAQEVLGLGEQVVRYDLVLAGDGSDLELRPGERLERPERRGERADTMTRAFRLNLLCLGFLAVLVGSFVAFNMAQFAVTRRRALLGRLRCLGCPARDLLRGVLLEAAVLGLVGGLVGVAGGRLLARVLVDDVTRTVATLYGPVGGTPTPELDAATAVGALVVGVLASVAATWVPARDAARTPPIAVAGQRPDERLVSAWTPVGLLVVALLLLLPTASAVLLPAVSVLCVLVALATALPRLLGASVRGGGRSTLTALAKGRIERSLGRTGSAAGALAMPLAMTIAIVVMVGSFRNEVVSWSDAVLGADVYVKPRFLELYPETARLPPELLDELEALAEVDVVDRLRIREEGQGADSFLLAGARLQMARQRGALRVLEGGTLDELLAAVDGGAVLVSEPLARRRQLGPGDALTITTKDGPAALPIAGVFQDFSLDRGYALLAEPQFLELLGDPGVRTAALILRSDADADALVERLAARHPGVVFSTVGRLRTAVLDAFNETFAVTYLLQAISTALALVGILTALLCLHLERRVELGVLRAIGARLPAVGQLLLLEAGIIMAVAVAAALPVGLGLAWILVAVVNTRSFGWSFPMSIDVGTLGAFVALALLAGVVAGLVPWLMVRRSSVARLLEVRA